jgi:hypothetical protein
MDFHDFAAPVEAQFSLMAKRDLFIVDIDGDELWQAYLAAFPKGTNPIFRKNTVHDCSCCRRFVKTLGHVVSLHDGKISTIWDSAEIEISVYSAVAAQMSKLITSREIVRPFLHRDHDIGISDNFGEVDGEAMRFEHFHANLPRTNSGKSYYCEGKDIATKLGQMKSTRDVFLRSLTTLTQDAFDTVLDLIAQGSLYRGDEHEHAIVEFNRIKAKFDCLVNPYSRELFAWENYDKVSPAVARIRNTAVGTLLIDISEEMELEQAVRKFESVMAPWNYKRPTALVSKAQVEKARQTIADLGLLDALDRRHARLSDISVVDILFADRTARKSMKGDVFDSVKTRPVSNAKGYEKIDTVKFDDFIHDVLPNVDSIEVMIENRHAPNFVSLIAPQHASSKPLFKWGNGFSWAYNGDVTDSMKEKVKRAGGNVTGDLCCRLAWFNHDDLDLHMAEPHPTYGRHRIYYAAKGPSPCGGRLDVDMNAGGGHTREPVENIVYPSRATMKAGVYTLSVNQYAKRETADVGFEIEIDWLGEVHRMSYLNAVSGKIDVATLRYDGKEMKIETHLPTTAAPRVIWGLQTQEWHRVTTVMLSPNCWAEAEREHGIGNMHLMFMIDGCVNDDSPRGFFNEYLRDDLAPHRKVMEIVGSKSKVAPTNDQLSGLGFSSTQRNELLVRAKGSFNRTIKVVF